MSSGGTRWSSCAGCERPVDVEGRKVEMEWGVAGQPIVRSQVEVGASPFDEMDDVSVSDADALGSAGGSGGEEDVREVGASRARDKAFRRGAGGVVDRERGPEVLTLEGTLQRADGDFDACLVEPVEQPRRLRRCQHTPRLDGADHLCGSDWRARRIDGNVDSIPPSAPRAWP